MVITQEQITGCALPSVISRARELAAHGDVKSVMVSEYGIAGEVAADGNACRCAVTINSDEFTWFDCTCGFSYGGGCEHCVAVLLSLCGKQEISNNLPVISESSGNPLPRLYLSESGKMLFVELRFAYQDGLTEFRRADTESTRLLSGSDAVGFIRIIRSRARESALSSELGNYDLQCYKSGVFTPLSTPSEWVKNTLPQLVQNGFEIYGHESLKKCAVREATPVISASVSSGGGEIYCDISAKFNGIPATLGALMDAARKNSSYVILSDGSTGVLPQDILNALCMLLAVSPQVTDSPVLRLPACQAGVFKEILDLADERFCDENFTRRISDLSLAKNRSAAELPPGFRCSLRHYQRAGFDWMCFLESSGLGGCLADDMGLGKTVQALAFLCRCAQNGSHRPSLVVAPSSVMFNWERESKRFSPGMPVMKYHGSGRHIYKNADFALAGIVLTTYGTLLKDIGFLEKIFFETVILDEAHTIKNPASGISRAVCRIKGRSRYALTGTPVENSLSELWSIFSFVNPGMLGRYRAFLRTFAVPIQKNDNVYQLKALKRITAPFIMRRTKKQAAPELPAKTETVTTLEMLPSQKHLYCVTRDVYRASITLSIERNGIEKSKFQILEGLLRLRQICSFPAMARPEYTGSSAKFEEIERMIPEIAAAGHRVLLFSQFVKALLALKERLTAIGIDSEMLTGKTVNRSDVVDRFQNGKSPVFLISLKAGGTGLNLTAADYVIHLDPWWNPAVEDQASDRAYRIGQTKPVFVYRLIMKDTIEEQIVQLQQKKRGLADSVIVEELSFVKQMSLEEIKNLFS
jgi:non-specific serine/threonine protein kinase